ncbi:DUF2933 domain-containing protein [Brevundimonas mediterranea]|uniref:DUF2933 domain-containing protein n=1 Tax=Brevundimonas mediterranea TaxID=74329 RepID=UPI00160628E8
MNWVVDNWPWLLFGAAFIGLHLVGHGGHGGHGGRGSRRAEEDSDGGVSREDDRKPPHVH